MGTWEKYTALIARIFGFIGGGAVAIMTINILLDASLRSAFATPIPGTLEYVQYWWMILIGLGGWALAAQTGQHIDAPIIGDRVSPRWQIVWRVVAYTATMVYLGTIACFAWSSALYAMDIQEYQGGYNTPIWPFRFFVPLAALSFLIVVFHQLVISIIEFRHFNDRAEPDTVGAEA